jgi:hypothetical protein
MMTYDDDFDEEALFSGNKAKKSKYQISVNKGFEENKGMPAMDDISEITKKGTNRTDEYEYASDDEINEDFEDDDVFDSIA